MREIMIDAYAYKKLTSKYINEAKGLQKIKGLNNNAEFVVEGLKVFAKATRDIPERSKYLQGRKNRICS